MVKLLKQKSGTYTLVVPKDKVKRKGWKGGELFDCEFDANGNLVFVEIKEKEWSVNKE